MTTFPVPIILFTYCRPRHTQEVLDALAKNDEAKNSELYIYCDGAKPGADKEMLDNIFRVREIANNEKRFRKVNVICNTLNKGLAASIIGGVAEVVNKYDRVIVLEDDILVSRGFLKYMNEALELYSDEESVGCIHSWNYHLDATNYHESTFFLKGADCWGWATWKRAWKLFNPNGAELLAAIRDNHLEFEFNRKGTHPFVAMLEDHIAGKNDSWAVRWHASLFIADKYCLHPTHAIVQNIGLDNSGVHCGISDMEQFPVSFVEVKKLKVRESHWFFTAYLKYIGKGKKIARPGRNVKNVIRPLIPPLLVSIANFFKSKNGTAEMWAGNYSNWEDAKKQSTGYNSEVILEKCKNALMKVKNGEAIYERDSVLFNTIQYSWGLIAGLQRAALKKNGTLTVLDFGGSLGSSYFQNKEFLSSIPVLQWSIVEQPHFVECGKKYFQDESLKFYYTLEECMEAQQPDVLVLSSVLPYLERPYEWIEKFISLDIPNIIIDRTPFIEGLEDVLTVQTVPEEIYSASYPAWFFGERFLEAWKPEYKNIFAFNSEIDHYPEIEGKNTRSMGYILIKGSANE
jgi:putative methyltransferase (TIGR04325 family)